MLKLLRVLPNERSRSEVGARKLARQHTPRTGTGLGLYIARGIIEAHGGRIWVESTPDRQYFRFHAATSRRSRLKARQRQRRVENGFDPGREQGYPARMHYRTLLAGLTLSLFSLACSDDDSPPPAGDGGTGGSGGSGNTALALTSTAFAEGEMIPVEHGCPGVPGGQDVSPPLSWTGGPSDAQSYAIVMRDIDFQNFLHWVIFDIPKSTGLQAGVEAVFQPAVPAGAKQSRFADGTPGYFGPCSPNSVNTYQFTVHALPTATLSGMTEQSTNQEAATAIEAASLASAKLAGES